MPTTVTINFDEASDRQREVARRAMAKLGELRDMLSELLSGEDPVTGELGGAIEAGLTQLGDLEELIRVEAYHNHP